VIVIELKPSRLLPVILIGVHTAAVFSFVLGFGWGWQAVLATGLSALSLARTWQLARRVPSRLGLAEEGTLVLEPDGGSREVLAIPQSSTVVFAWVVWLAWREEDVARRGAMLILPDQLSPAAWRELQVWIRLRARPHAAGPESGQL
jgi:hypothetical protein